MEQSNKETAFVLKIYSSIFIFFSLLGIWLILDLKKGYEKILIDTSRHARQQSQILGQSLRTQILATDYVLRDVLDRIDENDLVYPELDQNRTKKMMTLLKEKAATVPEFFSMVIFNKDCVFTATATGNNIGVKSKSEICEARKAYRGSGPMTSYVSGKKSVSGQSVLVLSRHMFSAAGEFQGGLMGVIELGKVQLLLNSLSFGIGDSVALLDDDHVLLARYPDAPEIIEKRVSTLQLPAPPTAEVGVTSVLDQVDIDGQQRLFGFSNIEGFPFLVVYGIEKAKIVEEWKWRAAQIVIGFLTSLLLILLVARSHWITIHQREDLRASEEHLRLLANNIPSAVFVIDHTGAITYLNSEAERLLGWRLAEVLGKNSHQLFHGTRIDGGIYPIVECPVHGALTSGVRREVLVDYLVRRDGSFLPVHIAASPFSKAGQQPGAVVAFSDMTEPLRLEQALRDAKESAEIANRTKSEFLANMSHEIRTPLTAIKGFIDMLKSDNFSADRRKDFFKIIDRNTRHLIRLINDVLDLSRIEIGELKTEMSTLDFQGFIEDAMSSLSPKAQAKGLDLRLETQDNLPKNIFTDSARLKQILFNVIGNAIKFTDNGSVTLKISRNLNRLVFWVTDTGRGIAPDDQKKIFDVFYQGSQSAETLTEGAGIGLALSHKLAEILRGKLQLIDSKLGVGSTFEFSMILDEVIKPIENQIVSEEVFRFSDIHILIVEDNPDNQTLMSLLLASTGAIVSVAQDGLMGCEMAKKQLFNLIITDIKMPRMNGLEFIHELRSLGILTPIIVLSANAFANDKESALRAGANAYLAKPVNPQDLFCLIRSQI